jgi:hypothetical protein
MLILMGQQSVVGECACMYGCMHACMFCMHACMHEWCACMHAGVNLVLHICAHVLIEVHTYALVPFACYVSHVYCSTSDTTNIHMQK